MPSATAVVNSMAATRRRSDMVLTPARSQESNGSAKGDGNAVGQRRTPAQDPRAAVEALFEIYEVWGDSVIRNLAQEPRHPALSILLDHGRTNHRRITEETYARWLDPLSGDDRQLTLDALVAATDIYVWKLARRDMRRSREECLELLGRLVDAVLAQAEKLASPPERRP